MNIIIGCGAGSRAGLAAHSNKISERTVENFGPQRTIPVASQQMQVVRCK